MSSSEDEIRVGPIMHEVGRRAVSLRRTEPMLAQEPEGVGLVESERVAQLLLRLEELQACVRQIGVMPDSPPTWRGRTGALVVRIMQRALFWLVPSLRQAHACTLAALREQALLTVEILSLVRETEGKVRLLLRAAEASSHD